MLWTASALAMFLLIASSESSTYDIEQMWKMWNRFKVKYNRSYSSGEENLRRFATFKTNILMIVELNTEQGIQCTDLFDDTACTFGITKYSDASPEELKSGLLARHASLVESQQRVPTLLSHPVVTSREKVVDWRLKGIVSPVNFQNKCGACWAFSIAQQMESAAAMVTGKLQKLSQQQILSCDANCVDGHGDCGCDGGDVVTGCEYVKKAGGLAALEDYPDTSSATGIAGNCSMEVRPIVRLRSFSYAVPPCNHSRDPRDERPCDAQDETSLANIVATNGPVSVSLTWGPGWWSYKGGIYDLACSNLVADIDHAMQIVGYDMSGPKPYWIVRNTFGVDWGIGGYIHLAMGRNLCGIANEAVVIDVEPINSQTSAFV